MGRGIGFVLFFLNRGFVLELRLFLEVLRLILFEFNLFI